MSRLCTEWLRGRGQGPGAGRGEGTRRCLMSKQSALGAFDVFNRQPAVAVGRCQRGYRLPQVVVVDITHPQYSTALQECKEEFIYIFI